MDLSTLTVLDFETEPIAGNVSFRAPKPVGLAIRWPNGTQEYLAWGHPTGNNCTREEAERAYFHATQGPCVFHNAKFDMEVAAQHFGIAYPTHWHDTLFLLFLHDPDAPNFTLKDSAHRILGIPPDERDKLREWILANVPEAKPTTAMAYVSRAPAELAAPYAIGDVDRTFKLFRKLYPKISTEQKEPYDREKRLLPHLVQAEKRGIRVDRDLLQTWEGELTHALGRCDELIRTRLNAPNLNVDSNDELARIMEAEGLFGAQPFEATDEPSVVAPSIFGTPVDMLTQQTRPAPKKRSMAKGVLRTDCTDKDLSALIIYRNSCATLLRTFITVWLRESVVDGRLHTTWHQVRGQDKNGARTGRIASADPNIANIPNKMNDAPPLGLPFLPEMRQALLPDEGEIWVSADYSQQELRILAHYEDGLMQVMYRHDPALDLHTKASELIKEQLQLDVSRKQTKNIAFATIYGAGLEKLAGMLGCTEGEAYGIREAYFKVLPGVPRLITVVKNTARTRGWIRSLGERRLPLEPAKLVKGKHRSFEYKMVNKLIQGSAADQTKEAIVWFCERGGAPHFRAQCYDEINLSVTREKLVWAIDLLTDSMTNAIPLDVPMLVDVEVGKNHAQTTPWKNGMDPLSVAC